MALNDLCSLYLNSDKLKFLHGKNLFSWIFIAANYN